MSNANKLITEAEKWVGYLEKKSNRYLNDFTANAGNNNYTRFAVDYCDYFGEKKMYIRHSLGVRCSYP